MLCRCVRVHGGCPRTLPNLDPRLVNKFPRPDPREIIASFLSAWPASNVSDLNLGLCEILSFGNFNFDSFDTFNFDSFDNARFSFHFTCGRRRLLSCSAFSPNGSHHLCLFMYGVYVTSAYNDKDSGQYIDTDMDADMEIQVAFDVRTCQIQIKIAKVRSYNFHCLWPYWVFQSYGSTMHLRVNGQIGVEPRFILAVLR